MTGRRLWAGLAAALMLLSGCGGVRPGINANAPTTGPADAVARITYRDNSVEYISQATLDRLRTSLYGAPDQPAPAEPVLNELLTRELLLRAARNNDIVADPQQVQRAVENIRTNPQACGTRVQQTAPNINPSDQQAFFDACARTFGFEDGSAFRNFIAEQLTVDDAAARLAPKDQIKAAHILFNESDLALAESTYDQLCGSLGYSTQPRELRCQGQADFAALARRLSIEPAAKQSGGELPPFNQQGLTDQGPFDSTFVSKTWELKPIFDAGKVAISQPFKTQFGWHIVKIQELVASQGQGGSVDRFRTAILERAKTAQLADLQQPASGDVPLLGVVEILKELPSPPAIPTPESIVPDVSEPPEATSVVPAEGTATPEAEPATTATP